MYKNKKVSVAFGTYNEAESIRSEIDAYFATGLVDEVVAVDNNALGNTASEIEKTKARHVKEQKQGYGYAYMRAMREATGDLIILTEVDGTFQPKDIEKFLAYSDEFDVVFGTRTSREVMWSGAFMPYPVRFGNWLWAKLIEVLFNGPVLSDVGCTYKLINRKSFNAIRDLLPSSKGDGTFNPELMIWLIRRKLKAVEIPVIYKERIGKSMYTGSVLRAARLGFRMLPVIVRYIFRKI